jgi:phosphatidylinositol alpha-mannosyltransferase
MADMDIFALPSEDGEGLPIALLEAGLLTRAVVCSDVGGMPEVVHDWVTGRLFPRGDEDALCKALEDLLFEPDRRAACGRALNAEVLAHHDIRAVHARYQEAYAQALAAA